MLKKFTIIVLAIIAFVACNSEPEKKKVDLKIDEEAFKSFTMNLRLADYMNQPSYTAGVAKIQYVKDFAEYKKNRPGPGSTEEQYFSALGKQFEIEKICTEVPAKLLKEFDAIQTVELAVPFKGKNYMVTISREEFEKYTGAKCEDLKKDWNGAFADKHLFDEAGRKAFYQKFVKEQ